MIKQATVNGKCRLLNPDDYTESFKRNLVFECYSCGKTFIRSFQHFIDGSKRCKECVGQVSIGEHIISNVLDSYNILYETEKTFKGCKYIKTLRFDFYLPDYNTCIEFDGYQHFHIDKRDNSEEELIKRQHRDEIKNQYCKNNHISLIRIPYWEQDNIEKIICDKLQITQIKDIV